MTFSTKGRYALRMMLEFALHPNECTKINQVAQRQEISDKYLEQIVTILSRAGLVKSRRGAKGGYFLTKDPSEYTVGMILRLAEGSLVPVACMEDEVNHCHRADICASLMSSTILPLLTWWKNKEDWTVNIIIMRYSIRNTHTLAWKCALSGL